MKKKFNNREAYDALLRTAEAIRSFGPCEFNALYQYKAPFWTVAAEAVRNGYQAVVFPYNGTENPQNRFVYIVPSWWPTDDVDKWYGFHVIPNYIGFVHEPCVGTHHVIHLVETDSDKSYWKILPSNAPSLETVETVVGPRYETRELTLLLNTADSNWAARVFKR